MATGKKYYWLKLKRDFFKRHDIRIIEDMPNGRDYILFYMKLLVESIDHEGHLRFSDTIPYSDQMLSTITNTNIDIVRSAVKIFSELNMMDYLDDGTLYMNQIEDMIGQETDWAQKKRIYRQGGDNVPQLSDKSKSKSKSKSKNIEYKEIIDYLNNAVGSSYKHTTGKTMNFIKARYNEGFTLADFKTVIDNKVKEWKGTDFQKYLRPETLFGTKFESYLNQKISRKDDKPISNEIKHKSIIEGIDYDS